MMVFGLIRTPHGHSSQELLKTPPNMVIQRTLRACIGSPSLLRLLHVRIGHLHRRRRGGVPWQRLMMGHMLWRLPGLNSWFWCRRCQITTIHTALRIAAATGGQNTAAQHIPTDGTGLRSGRQSAEATQSMAGIGVPTATTTKSVPTPWTHDDIISLALVDGQRNIVHQMPGTIDTGTFALQVEATTGCITDGIWLRIKGYGNIEQIELHKLIYPYHRHLIILLDHIRLHIGHRYTATAINCIRVACHIRIHRHRNRAL